MILKNSSCSMYFTQSSRKSPGKHRRTATSSAGGIKEAAAQHVARGRGPTPSGERTSTTRCYMWLTVLSRRSVRLADAGFRAAEGWRG